MPRMPSSGRGRALGKITPSRAVFATRWPPPTGNPVGWKTALALWRENLANQDRRGIGQDGEGCRAQQYRGRTWQSQEAGEAIAYGEEAVRLSIETYRPDHPMTLVCRSHLATVYRDADMVEHAIPQFEEVFRLMKIKPGPDHPDTLACRSQLTVCYQISRRWANAEPLIRDWVQELRQERPLNRRLLAGSLHALGHVLIYQEKWTDAETTLRRVPEARFLRTPGTGDVFGPIAARRGAAGTATVRGGRAVDCQWI